jgi:putative ABC transport system permease protein
VIVGGRRPEAVGGTVPFFGRSFVAYGRLALTGVGPFERAYFVTFETASDIAAAARETTGRSFDASRGRVSAVLVRLEVGATPEQVQFAASRFPEARIVVGNGLTTSVRQTLTTILGGGVVFTILVLSTTAIMVGALYTGLLAERRRELGLLMAVGMRPAAVVRLVLVEAVLTTGLGGLSGALLAAASLMLFERSIGFAFASHHVPFAWPPARALLEMGFAGVFACGSVGLAGALLPAIHAVRREPFALVRGEGD